ncbi:MAG: diacylglycerol kinase family protein [Bacteroidia bacterium]
MKKHSILFIANPKAGTRRGVNFSEVILKCIDIKKYDYEIKYTERAHHATELAADAVQHGIEYCFAIGGDGTVNEVAKALKGSQTCLGIIPCGSGNGLARHLKISLKIEKAFQLIDSGKILRIDTMLVNGIFSVNVSGIGFDAHVAAMFGKGGGRGFWNYTKLVMNEFKKYPEQQFEITCDGYTTIHKLIVVAFANSSQFGNNAYIAPNASVVDEYLDITMLRKMNLFNALMIAPKLFTKKLDDSKYVEIIQGKNIFIKTEKPVALHIDGEPSGESIQFEIQIQPGSLNVLLPETTYR